MNEKHTQDLWPLLTKQMTGLLGRNSVNGAPMSVSCTETSVFSQTTWYSMFTENAANSHSSDQIFHVKFPDDRVSVATWALATSFNSKYPDHRPLFDAVTSSIRLPPALEEGIIEAEHCLWRRCHFPAPVPVIWSGKNTENELLNRSNSLQQFL